MLCLFEVDRVVAAAHERGLDSVRTEEQCRGGSDLHALLARLVRWYHQQYEAAGLGMSAGSLADR